MDKIQNKVLSRAIKLTLTGVQTDAAREISTEINLTQAKIKESFKLTTPSLTNLSGKFSSTGKPLGLVYFGARQTNIGVSVKIKKRSSRTLLRHAFMASIRTRQMKSDDDTAEQVFSRKYRGARGVVGKKAVKRAWRKLPAYYRVPIEKLYTTRVPDILSNDPVMKSVLSKANERLHTNINHELDYELSKLRSAS